MTFVANFILNLFIRIIAEIMRELLSTLGQLGNSVNLKNHLFTITVNSMKVET